MHSNNVVHFAVNADDVARAKTFYENVFGWRFEEWGPPDFYLIQTGESENCGIRGALQQRTEPMTGTGSNGYECSISVQNLHSTATAIKANGGQIVMDEVEIPSVGRLIKFSDTEGNIACAMQYNEGVL